MAAKEALLGIGLAILGSIVSAVAVSLVLLWLPADYFDRSGEPTEHPARHPVARVLLLVGKNVLGVLLVAIGVVFLFTPGQGLLTILLGLVLVDFPGKYRLERAIVSRPSVFHAINKLRDRFGRPPLGYGRFKGAGDPGGPGAPV